MSDFKDRMIEAVERGWATDACAYEYVRESYADRADYERKRQREDANLSAEIGGEENEKDSAST